MSRSLPSRTVHGSWLKRGGKVDSLIFMLRNRGLEGRACVCVSWLSGANSTVPSLCAGRPCSGSRDCPCREPGVTRRFGVDEIGGWGFWASVDGRLLTPRLRAASHQTHQVRAGHDPGGVWLRPLRATRHGAAQGLQGQAGPQVHQEKGGDTHPREEEERGAEQRLGRHEESGSQEGLSPSPLLTINLAKNSAFLCCHWKWEGSSPLRMRGIPPLEHPGEGVVGNKRGHSQAVLETVFNHN